MRERLEGRLIDAGGQDPKISPLSTVTLPPTRLSVPTRGDLTQSSHGVHDQVAAHGWELGSGR